MSGRRQTLNRDMKKIFLISVSIVCFFSVNAQFRSTQRVCCTPCGYIYEFYNNGYFKGFLLVNGQENDHGRYIINNNRITVYHQWNLQTVFATTITGGRLEKMWDANDLVPNVYTVCNSSGTQQSTTMPAWAIGHWGGRSDYPLFSIDVGPEGGYILVWRGGGGPAFADFISVNGEVVWFKFRPDQSMVRVTRLSSNQVEYHNTTSGSTYVVPKQN